MMTETTHPTNFYLGIILSIMALFFMFTDEYLGFTIGQLDTLFLALAGVFSLWASFSIKELTVMRINLLMGLLFLVGSVLIFIIKFSDTTFTSRRVFDLNLGDVLFHALIGGAFLYNFIRWRKEHYG